MANSDNDIIITPRHLIKRRVQALRQRLRQKGFESVLIMSPANIRYLSGFTGSSAYVYISASRALLFTDFRYITQAKLESGSDPKAPGAAPGGEEDFSYEIIRIDGSYIEPLSDAIRSDSVKNIALEADFVSFFQYKQLSEKLPVDSIKDIGSILTDLRSVKDEHEISLMREAAAIADKAFQRILGFIRPGIAEKDISDEIEYYLKRAGASSTSFDTIAVSGLRTAMPHGKPGSRLIQDNDIITIDFGAVYRGYCSDMTRTFFTGRPDKALLKIYTIVNEARAMGIEKARGGISGKDLDAVSRDFIARQGYGDYFGHGLGHGVGLEIHEEPRVSPRFSGVIPSGAVVTIEPGIYIENQGGVRIEDMILVTDNGCEVLSGSSREVIVL